MIRKLFAAHRGLALLKIPGSRTWPRLITTLLGWSGFHIGVFYLGLTFTNHWTWSHTFWIATVLGISAAAIVIAASRRNSQRVPPAEVTLFRR